MREEIPRWAKETRKNLKKLWRVLIGLFVFIGFMFLCCAISFYLIMSDYMKELTNMETEIGISFDFTKDLIRFLQGFFVFAGVIFIIVAVLLYWILIINFDY